MLLVSSRPSPRSARPCSLRAILRSGALAVLLLQLAARAPCLAQAPAASDPMMGGGGPNPLSFGSGQKQATALRDNLYVAYGFGNTFMVTTSEGNVVIDTSMSFQATRHHKLLTAANAGPVRYVILTHGHPDHIGGVHLWKGEYTEVIAQRRFKEFMEYQERLGPMFDRRNSAQFGGAGGLAGASKFPRGDGPGGVPVTILFDDKYEFELGGVKFEVHATPGETYDHCSVRIPSMGVVFCGDNFYPSFPNMYTLRGTQPRWATDYIASLDRYLEWAPELLCPSHVLPVEGREEVARQVKRYRDAIAYVHDETVRGMNEGKDVFTLMREVKLPADLDVGEGYGRIAWSVRGIYEGYMGWFDENPASMYEFPVSEAYPDMVELAGGPEKVVERGVASLEKGDAMRALHLADIALSAAPADAGALRLRIAALEKLEAASVNSNEKGWLKYGIAEARKRLSASERK